MTVFQDFKSESREGCLKQLVRAVGKTDTGFQFFDSKFERKAEHSPCFDRIHDCALHVAVALVAYALMAMITLGKEPQSPSVSLPRPFHTSLHFGAWGTGRIQGLRGEM